MGDSFIWILWVVLGVVLIIAEVFTPGFVLLWFGIGALAAALGRMLGAGPGFQFLVFISLPTLLTALSRTIFVKYFTREGEPDGLKSGAAGTPGGGGPAVPFRRGGRGGGRG